MARAEQKVNDLLAEDSDMGDALSTVLIQADSNGGTVEWEDVKGDLTSGQWGRLIEKGVLRSANSGGFSVQNPKKVRAALNDNGTTTSVSRATADDADSDEEDDEGWSTYDKIAGLCALAFFPAYWYQPLRDMVAETVDLVLGPLDAVMPFYAVVIVLSVLTGLYSTLLQANLMDTEMMGEVQEKMSDIQERRKEAKERGDEEAIERIQQEQMDAMGDQLGMFKAQFRPMVWITLLTIPVFVWLIWMIGRGGTGHLSQSDLNIILPLVGQVEWTEGIVGPIQAWLVWYFLCSIGFRQIIQKSLNIQTTPSTS
jgi:uncharacterized membrane protein (DUF106 family)